MQIEVSSAVMESILVLAEFAHPRECCGILFGALADNAATISSFVPATNVHASPERCFEIDPRALIAAHKTAREGGPAIAGYYHSHPNGLAAPSATDREQAAHDGAIWLIVANGEVSGWKDLPDGFAKVSLRVVDA